MVEGHGQWWRIFPKISVILGFGIVRGSEKGIANNVFMCVFSFAKIGPLHHTSPIIDVEILKSRKSFNAN